METHSIVQTIIRETHMSDHLNHGMPSGDARAPKISGWLTSAYFVVKLLIGFRSGPVAVLADAFHTFSAVAGVQIALAAAYFALSCAGGVLPLKTSRTVPSRPGRKDTWRVY